MAKASTCEPPFPCKRLCVRLRQLAELNQNSVLP
uniref:Uncharacterized protein n=1 Tax=Arundo donax TaxID=35708 RepID=A0A0A9BBF7_ARUDO